MAKTKWAVWDNDQEVYRVILLHAEHGRLIIGKTIWLTAAMAVKDHHQELYHRKEKDYVIEESRVVGGKRVWRDYTKNPILKKFFEAHKKSKEI